MVFILHGTKFTRQIQSNQESSPEIEVHLNKLEPRLFGVDILEAAGESSYPKHVDFGYILSHELYFAGISQKDLAALLKRDPAVVNRFAKGRQLPSRKQINLILSAFPNPESRERLRRAYSREHFDRPRIPREDRNAPEFRRLIAKGDYDGLYNELRSLRSRHVDPLIKFSIDLVTFELCLLSSHFYRATLAIQRMRELELHDPGVHKVFAGTAQGLLYRHLGMPDQAIPLLEKAQATLTPGVFKNTSILFGFSITPLIWHELVLSKLQLMRGEERSAWARHAALETYDRIDDDLSGFDIACLYATLCHCQIHLKDSERLHEAIDLLSDHASGYHPDIDTSWSYAIGNASRFRLIQAESSLIGGNLSDCLEKFSALFDKASELRDTYHLSIAQRRFQEISRRALTEGYILPDTLWPDS